jgi:hypothetical protein
MELKTLFPTIWITSIAFGAIAIAITTMIISSNPESTKELTNFEPHAHKNA